MKNQNSISKSTASHSTKQKTKMMNNENQQQQIHEENNYYNSNEKTAMDSPLIPLNEKVNMKNWVSTVH